MRPERCPLSMVAAAISASGFVLVLAGVAAARDSTPSGLRDSPTELAVCVREARAERPRRPYLAGVVSCLRPTRVETTSVLRWSTCRSGGAPDPMERCETGSARITFRSTKAVWERRPPGRSWPRWAARWHLYGRGTARCTRTIHQLSSRDRRARHASAGQINHLDFLGVAPSAGGTIAVGVSPRWSNPLPEGLHDAVDVTSAACSPLLALDALRLRPSPSLPVDRLETTAGVVTGGRTEGVVRTREIHPSIRRRIGLVGGGIHVQIDSRTSATFEIRRAARSRSDGNGGTP